MRLVSPHNREKIKVQYTIFKYCRKSQTPDIMMYSIFSISTVRWRGGFAVEADRELIGERLGRNQWLSADQCNEGPLNITPGLNPPISSKRM